MAYTTFSALEKELRDRKGVRNPSGLAAYIARKKFGKRRVQKAARLHQPIRKVR